MKGSQTPQICIEPPRLTTDGDLAAKLMEAYGLTLDEWQQTVINCWLGKAEDGLYTVTSGGLSVPRQNGKNVCLEAREFYGAVVNGEKILHSAHQARTARKAFRRLAAMFTDTRHPEITKLVKRIKYGIGEEAIELQNGGSIEFISRTKQAARGYDALSLLVYDEAQELTDEQNEAIVSTLSASATGIRQMLFCGTPPYPGCQGTVFRRLRQATKDAAGTKDEPLENSWHEWGVQADSITDIDLVDVSLWYACNPALGYRLSEKFTAAEARSLSPDGFARERLGWWSRPMTQQLQEKAIDTALWDACKSDKQKPEGKTAYGVKISADGSIVVLAGAVVPAAPDPARISLIKIEQAGRGLAWLATWLNERYSKAACVVIDGRQGADVLVDKISDVWKMKGSVIKPTAQNVSTAAALLVNELREQTVTWYAPQEELRESAVNATKRNIGQGWGFGGQGAELVEACSLALWGARTTKRNPTRKMKIG